MQKLARANDFREKTMTKLFIGKGALNAKATRRSFVAGLGAIAIALPLAGAFSGAYGQTAKTIKIAFSVDVLDQTQNVALDAMKARVDEINKSGKGITVLLDVYDAQSSANKQLSDVQTALIKKPDVLILSAVDAKGSLPAAQAAKNAGVKVIDKRPSSPEPAVFDVAFYSNDEARYSKATTDWIQDYLKKNPAATLKVGLIYGAPAQTAQLPRCDAIKALAKTMPDRIQIVASGYGNWLTVTAQNLTQDWLQAHPDMNYVAAANDIMALGAANALAAAGKSKEILVSGYDLEDAGVQRIKNGTQALDVGVALQGNAQVIDVAVGLAEGTFKDRSYYINPVYSVDAANVNNYAAK
jgi:ABC-type sugar transport system substrate-binding protein